MEFYSYNPCCHCKEDKDQEVDANGKVVLVAGSIPGEIGKICERRNKGNVPYKRGHLA